MTDRPDDRLSRRERQVMDIVYRRGEATAADVLAELDDPPGNTAVRLLDEAALVSFRTAFS